MIELVHGAVGAACGTLLRRRTPTLLASVLAHFLIDLVNHEEPIDKPRHLRRDVVALDGILLGSLFVYLAIRYGATSPESLGAVAGCLPDLEYLVRRRGAFSPHASLPHAVWPRRRMSLRGQFLLGGAAWLVLFAYRSLRAPSHARA